MAEVDTSSYPKAVAPPNPLDIAHKLGTIQQQSIAIDKAKLDQANQALGYLTRAFSSIGPDGTKEQYLSVGQNAVKLGLAPPQMLTAYTERLNAAPTPRAFFDEVMTAASSHQEMVNYHLGPAGTFSNGQTVTPIRTPGKTGMPVATDRPYQVQVPPTAGVVTPDNQPALLGAQPPDIAPGSGAVPGPRLPAAPAVGVAPVVPQSRLPVAVPQVPPMVTPTRAQATPAGVPVAPGGPPVPRGPVTGAPPMFEEGKKALTEDQELATQKLTAIKPALQVLPLLQGLRSGPTTEAWTRAVATLKANNIIPIGTKDDPTVIRQIVEKKLADYVRSNPVGQRSDAAQHLSEKASPSAGTQINPALIKLTKDAIVLDRVQAARASAFEGKDYSKYGAHRAMFPATIDEKAFGIDLMEPAERTALIEEMKKKRDTIAGKKFWKSLELVDKQGLIDTSGQ